MAEKRFAIIVNPAAAGGKAIKKLPEIAAVARAGDNIVSTASLYGGTVNMLAQTLPRFGITTTFVKPRDLAGRQALRMDRQQMPNRSEAGRLRQRSKAVDGNRFSMTSVHWAGK